MTVEKGLTWHSEDQREIFALTTRFIVLAAGRRWGKTKGAFHRMVRRSTEKKRKSLWVDTTQGNIEKYFDEHLEPLLLRGTYHWDRRKKVLKFLKNGSIVHFGSAQVPENLEGFGYHDIYLNEAGEILKGDSGARLWQNTIRPMGIEHKAKVLFIGTPKGLGLFSDFYQRGNSDDPQWDDWISVHRVSMDRPGITQEEIDQLIAETPGGVQSQVYRQEILAEFLGHEEGESVIPYEEGRMALNRNHAVSNIYRRVWGVDPSDQGEDVASLCKRQGNTLVEPTKIKPGKLGPQIGAMWIKDEYGKTPQEERPHEIIVDSNGIGSGWVDIMSMMGLPVRGVNWTISPLDKERYFQYRDELWFMAAEWIKTGSLAGDYELFTEIVKPLVDMKFLNERGKYKAESKDLMKKRLKRDGQSPNRADAFVLTMAGGTELVREVYDYDDEQVDSRITFMGAW